jgi:hypothetical protein
MVGHDKWVAIVSAGRGLGRTFALLLAPRGVVVNDLAGGRLMTCGA